MSIKNKILRNGASDCNCSCTRPVSICFWHNWTNSWIWLLFQSGQLDTTRHTCVMSLWKPSYSIDGNVVQIQSSQLHNQAILSKLPRHLSDNKHIFLALGAVKLIWYDLSWSGGEADGRVLFSQGSRGRRRFLSGDQLFTRVAFWFLRFPLSLATSLRSSRHLSTLFVS